MIPPTVTEFRQRTGGRIAVLVEGESQREDQFFLETWFPGHARTIAFHAWDGCSVLLRDLAQLRSQFPQAPIYGILDRDFCEEEQLREFNRTLAQTHAFKMERHSIENYLLEPEGWYRTIKAFFLREGPPSGWDSAAALDRQIRDAFEASLPAAAHNWVVSECGAAALPRREYLPHVKAVGGRDLAMELARWGVDAKVGPDLGDRYAERLALLRQASELERRRMVPGKLVLSVLHDRLPEFPRAKKPTMKALLDGYIERYPDAPEELSRLLERIRASAEAEKSSRASSAPD